MEIFFGHPAFDMLKTISKESEGHVLHLGEIQLRVISVEMIRDTVTFTVIIVTFELLKEQSSNTHCFESEFFIRT